MEYVRELVVDITVLERFGLLKVELRTKLHGCQRHLMIQLLKKLKQGRTMDHFRTV